MNRILFLLCLSFLLACTSTKNVVEAPKKRKVLSEKEEVAFGRVYLEATKEKILGNYETAVELYQKALSIDPSSPAANYELGITYNNLGNTDQAYQQFKMAAEQEPSNYWYQLSYATFLQSQGNIEESIKAFKSLVENNPKKIELKYELSKLLLSNKRPKEAIEYLDQIEAEIGISEDISFLKQRIYLSANDAEGAAKEIEKLIEKYPAEIRYYGILADIYLSNEKRKEALEVYEKMEQIAPDDYLVQFSLAEFYRTKGDDEKYSTTIKKAFANPEMDIDDKVKYVLTFYQVDGNNTAKKKEGIELCKIISEAHPNDAKSFALYADFLYFDEQLEKSKSAYRRTIELDSSRFPVWNQLLVILSETNDLDLLLNYGKRSVDLFPSQPSVYLLYGLGLSQNKEFKKAIDYLTLGKDLVVDNQALKSQIYSSIGDSHHSLKNHKKSDFNYDKALELDPNNVYVLNNYSYYLSLRKEKLEKAKEMSLKSNTLAPNQPSFQDTYAWILYQLGEYQDANDWIEKALELDREKSGTLLEHKGDIEFKLGNKEEAIKFWKKAKASGEASDLIEKKISEEQLYE